MLALVAAPAVQAQADAQVYLGGIPLGIKPVGQGLVVQDLAPVGNAPSPCAGKVQAGDVLRTIDGRTIDTRADVAQAIDGRIEVQLGLVSNGKALYRTVRPAIDSDGVARLGLYLVQGLEGLGTLTFVIPDTYCYGALGHGVEDSVGLAPVADGAVYAATISGVRRGQKGDPGELRGHVGDKKLGDIQRNTSVGLYGAADSAMVADLSLVEVAPRSAVQTGDAVIVCTVQNDKIGYYAVKITALQRKADVKGITLTVTDPRLSSITGGIVQGMSGSPILQNGRLVGAVTHVTVDDPALGYGVFVDVMLQQCAMVRPLVDLPLPRAA